MSIGIILLIALIIYIAIRNVNDKQSNNTKLKNQSDKQNLNNNENHFKDYEKKPLMSRSEIEIGKKLVSIIPNDKYLLQTQIPLSSIIHKTNEHSYAGELYRTIDFGIFDKATNVKVLIEVNDSSHLRSNRRARDFKVKNILDQAGIPLITLWTNRPNTTEYIKTRLSQYITIE